MRVPLPQPIARESLTPYLVRVARAVTRAEVLAHWSRHRLDQEVRAGGVVRILPGVYCAAVQRDGPHIIGEAITLWNPAAVVTGQLALALSGVPGLELQGADAMVPSGSHPRAPAWLRTHQTAPVTVLTSQAGVRCTTAERSVVEAWRRGTLPERIEVLYAALWSRVCTWRQVRTVVLADRQLPGRRELLRMLGWFAQGATSPLEVEAKHRTFAGRDFHDFEWQIDLEAGGRRWVADVFHSRAKLILELDGERHHSSTEVRRRDRERDIVLAAAGYMTLRFTWRDVITRPEWCRTQVLTVLTSRLASVSRT